MSFKMVHSVLTTSFILFSFIANVDCFHTPSFVSKKASLSWQVSKRETFETNDKRRFITSLNAKKSKTKKRAVRNTVGNRTKSSSGFGGAAVEECPCGSELGYMKCCGKIHKDANAYAAALPSQVVRARYSAYAKREVDFIVGSTHPLNKDFMSDIEHWKETIRYACCTNKFHEANLYL